jgi:phosphohistidine phosphatase
MDRLILLRHGDAERDSESGDDFDRRLSSRGREESARMGETLAELGLVPDLVLVSAAARTRGTWTALAETFPQAQVRFEDELYLAEPERVRRAIDQACDGCATLMVVGHNPGLQDLALGLLIEGSAQASAIDRVTNGFPTAAAAVFLFDGRGLPTYDGVFFPRDRR